MTPSFSPLAPTDFDKVAHIQVHPAQQKFAGTVAEAFETAEPGVDFHAIYGAGFALGFFKIDRAYPEKYPFAQSGDLGLRAFIIDRAHQGQGWGQRAVSALPAYLRRQYPQSGGVTLTVNLSNPAALASYLKGGFINTQEQHPHGDAGPQWILRMGL